ncbi:MAG: adenosylmethionine decarboxylase [Candidatus Edwardsbacteria bacterium]|nr:adenosylmethionine decarboxylase [Candidatus Edwardsbacteria bacterium]
MVKYKERNIFRAKDTKVEVKPIKKLKLYGFNNLTKTLSFNMYDICHAKGLKYSEDYIKYIDEEYNAARLTKILKEVASIIGAKVLNIAQQDYDPQGASVTMLISEQHLQLDHPDFPDAPAENIQSETVVGHLDKSHITVHTYPESHPQNGISTFRADIDVSTCGVISPLKALNYLLDAFYSDIAVIDYRVRGFTRDLSGRKYFIDHKINSIQNYLYKDVNKDYQLIDTNVYHENIFHTKMLLRDFNIDDYIFGRSTSKLRARDKVNIKKKLLKEMAEIFFAENI